MDPFRDFARSAGPTLGVEWEICLVDPETRDLVPRAAEVIDESFRGQNRVQQQRMVYAALKGRMDGPAGALHALALTTRAPD